mmetsp:Transcript_61664/g.161995  ORF Transcript_61664/g.161995 Transcript_61664/m.161995 type:complete len:634 (-) Transcript_61664:1176-3077(-)
MREDAAHTSEDQPGVRPRRHLNQGAVLGQGVERVEHLDDHEHRQREGRCLDLSCSEVRAGVRVEGHALEGPGLEVGPRAAVAPAHELRGSDQRVAVHVVVEDVPPDEDPDGGEADVQADDHVAEEDPTRDEIVILAPGRLGHHVEVGWVKAERGRREAVGHQIHPEQLNRREALGNAQGGREEDGRHLADVGGDQVADEGLHVVVDGAPLLDGGDDRREVVVGEDHVGRLLGDFRARDAHRDADVGLLQCRRVVDAVASHRGDLAERPQQPHDLLLVLRLRAREHRTLGVAIRQDAREHLSLLGVGHLLKLFAGEGLPAQVLWNGQDAEVRGDGLGRGLVVARDHDDADAGDAAVRDGLLALRARGVDDPDHAEEGEFLLDVDELLGVREVLVARMRAAIVVVQVEAREVRLHGQREGAQRILGHLVHLGLDRLLAGLREGLGPAVRQHDGGAPVQDALGGALDVQDVALSLRVGAEDAHGLPVARELEDRLLLDTFHPILGEGLRVVLLAGRRLEAPGVQGLVRAAQLLDEDPDGRLRGLACPDVLPVGVDVKARLVAVGTTLRECGKSLAAPVQRKVVDLSDGDVRVALHDVGLQRRGARRKHNPLATHLVGGQRASLVRADHSRTPQRLD